MALDAPDVVAGALGVSHVHAQRRVELAVRLVADGAERENGDAAGGVGERGLGAGLSALHSAMAVGHLDAYRAGVVADELTEAPIEVAEAVVGVLVPYLGVETPVQLRRRCRRALARISPDLLRQRAKRAREASGLRRWVEEPGVDRWEGTFPSEQAAEGWAAVDALARRYVADGRCERVEAARAQALMDLIRGQATIDVQLVVTVPAGVVTDDAPSASPVGDEAPLADGLVASSAESTVVGGSATAAPGAVPADESSPPRVVWRGDPSRVLSSGQAVGDGQGLSFGPMRRGTSADEAANVTSDDDLVEVSGPFPGDPVLVGRAWIRSFLREQGPPGRSTAVRGHHRTARSPSTLRPSPGAHSSPRTRLEACHPVTGALLGRALTPGRAYRPGRRLAALVRARDGRCRFPGCSVAARFCDLDHVRPWPAGSTSAANLICLCRRHHRIKQRPGWTVRLRPDARAVWTDPTGRVRTTWPRDLLHAVVLPAAADAAGPVHPASRDAPDRVGPPVGGDVRGGSGLAALLEVLGEHLPTQLAGGRRTVGVTLPCDVRVHVVTPEPHRRLVYAGARRDHPPPGPHRHLGRRRRDVVGTGPPPCWRWPGAEVVPGWRGTGSC